MAANDTTITPAEEQAQAAEKALESPAEPQADRRWATGRQIALLLDLTRQRDVPEDEANALRKLIGGGVLIERVTASANIDRWQQLPRRSGWTPDERQNAPTFTEVMASIVHEEAAKAASQQPQPAA